MKHKLTNETLEFKDSKEFIHFLKIQNPSFLKYYKEQYKKENKGYFIDGIGKGIVIKKIS